MTVSADIDLDPDTFLRQQLARQPHNVMAHMLGGEQIWIKRAGAPHGPGRYRAEGRHRGTAVAGRCVGGQEDPGGIPGPLQFCGVAPAVGANRQARAAEEQQGRLNGFGKRLGGPLAVSCLWVLHGLGLCWRRNKYPEVSDIQTREETILSGTGFRSDTVRLRCRPGSPA